MDVIFIFRQLRNPQFIMNKIPHKKKKKEHQGQKPVKFHNYFMAPAFIKKK